MAAVLWLLAALLTLALDQASKTAILHALQPDQSIVGIPHLILFTYVQNRHGAFGLFGSHAVVLIALALAVLVFFYTVVRRSMVRSPLVQIAFGMIVGGAAGNIADRVHYGFVVDFLQFAFWQAYPVFNVADALILIGVLLLFSVTSDGGRRATHRPETVMDQPESGGRASWSEGRGDEIEYARSPESERALRRLRGERSGEIDTR